MKSFWQSLIPIITSAFLFACSDNNDSAGGATEGTNGFAIIDKDIAGLSQKGPFVKGSPITVLELDKDNFKQTGRAFRGKIGEKGEFTVQNLNLESNYAILEASGYYLNEITGKKSESTITLNALADLSGREKVNINLLTQIQYERVQKLVESESMSLIDAKKQSKKEILKAFYSDDDYDFEDMNIFGSERSDALLLAISVMVQGNHSTAELTELLYDMAMDLQENGEFNNDSICTEIADHAAFNINPAQIRKNILSWEIADSLPDFEHFIHNFWANEFKLGKCDSENEGEIKKNGNKKSSHTATRFICKNDTWRPVYYNPEVDYGTITDKRDNQTYRTTKIGNQVWIAENMRFRPKGSDVSINCYNDEEKNCDTYGPLYNLNGALEACPEGFHLPSNEEWMELADAVGGDSIAGAKLRAVGGWATNNHPQTIDDKDEFGFSALPAGVYYFGAFGDATYFWTSNTFTGEDGTKGALNVLIGSNSQMKFGGNSRATTQTSVRCVKDGTSKEDSTEKGDSESSPKNSKI